MSHVFQLLRSVFEKLMGIIKIKRDTRTEGIDERKPPVLDAPFNQLDQMFYLAGVPPRHIGSSSRYGKRNRIDWIFDAAYRRTFGFHSFCTRRRNLSRREAVDLIVHDDVSQIDVAAHGMNEVVAADTVAVAIAAGGDNLKLVIG